MAMLLPFCVVAVDGGGDSVETRSRTRSLLQSVTQLLAVALVLRVTLSVVWNYRNYFPPNFSADFLRDRESYFFGPYSWAFYVHLVTGPITLLLGTLLVMDRLRMRFPEWHKRLGRIQGMCILGFMTPSGLYMAFYADAGPVAAVGFVFLALATAACVAFGWRAAVQRRFVAHRAWMWRCYALLCSAVVIRIVGGFGAVMGIDTPWVYQASAWMSWIGPLILFELIDRISRSRKTRSALLRRPIDIRG